MPASVLLRVVAGPMSGTEQRFEEPTVAIAGRSRECNVKLPNDEAHGAVSRMHCFLDVNPPSLRVRDFGSRNGTFVNGRLIGRREKSQSIEEGRRLTFPEVDIRDGDRIQIGTTVFEVRVQVPLGCVACGREATDAEAREAARAPTARAGADGGAPGGGAWRCAACKEKARGSSLVIDGVLTEARTCARCGAPVARESDPLRRGEVVCDRCRDDTDGLLKDVLAAASASFDAETVKRAIAPKPAAPERPGREVPVGVRPRPRPQPQPPQIVFANPGQGNSDLIELPPAPPPPAPVPPPVAAAPEPPPRKIDRSDPFGLAAAARGPRPLSTPPPAPARPPIKSADDIVVEPEAPGSPEDRAEAERMERLADILDPGPTRRVERAPSRDAEEPAIGTGTWAAPRGGGRLDADASESGVETFEPDEVPPPPPARPPAPLPTPPPRPAASAGPAKAPAARSAAPAGFLGTFAGYQLQRRLTPDEMTGIGDAYVARLGPDGDEVEVRVLLPKVAVSELGRKAFLDELAILQTLHHQNILSIRGSGHVIGAFYVVYERVKGLTVEALVRACGPLPVTDAVDIALQALAALQYVHEKTRSLHRDISPRTLVVHRPGQDDIGPAGEAGELPFGVERQVKVADTGLARAYRKAGLADPNMTGDCVGTPACMPRQQLLCFKLMDASHDVWAVAAVLYFLLTRAYPRNYASDADQWKVTLTEPPVPIAQRRPDVPPKLAKVLDEALDDRKELRYESARSLAAALREGLW